MLADVLREKILRGEFPEGEALPPERMLVEQSRLTRATVREALSILKQQGLIVTRQGRHGGSVVTRPSAGDLRDSLELYIKSQGWTAGSPALTEIREIVEPWCARLAAARRTEDDGVVLQRRLSVMRRDVDVVEDYVAASLGWHFAVADASHNTLLSALMHARSEDVVSAADRSRYDEVDARLAAIAAHEEVTRAIVDRDPQQAYELMERHVRTGKRRLLDELEAEAASR